jgi:hypothetical protein
VSIPPFNAEAAKPAFAFARALADPDFRARLKTAGHNGDVCIAMWPNDTIDELGARLRWHPDEPDRKLLAWPDDEAPQGWRLAWVEEIP